jgi:low affinity Fe/Cu permease
MLARLSGGDMDQRGGAGVAFEPNRGGLAMSAASETPRLKVRGPMAWIGRLLTSLGMWTASPWAFLLFAAYVGAWCAFGSHALGWHEVATIATWLMTLCIQRAEHRDTQALQAKIDALIRAVPGAEDALTHIDEEEPEAIERRRNADGA